MSFMNDMHERVARTSCTNEFHERVSRTSCTNKLHEREARKSYMKQRVKKKMKLLKKKSFL